jgi:hypothetical protein
MGPVVSVRLQKVGRLLALKVSASSSASLADNVTLSVSPSLTDWLSIVASTGARLVPPTVIVKVCESSSATLPSLTVTPTLV